MTVWSGTYSGEYMTTIWCIHFHIGYKFLVGDHKHRGMSVCQVIILHLNGHFITLYTVHWVSRSFKPYTELYVPIYFRGLTRTILSDTRNNNGHYYRILL